uniref:G-protein coupled receptors family 1 profile domain-containing protein n=1 Tax=Timema bartmani TaxID=61472 RepID=A0A7R9I6L0_9NEOP|nr:unnamed protein product [Timema bartmani]
MGSKTQFLAIWWPLKCQITKRRARIMIVFIWVIALTTTIPWAVFFDLVSIFRDAPEIQLCLEVWPEALDGDLYFLIANLVFCYILPMILISMCYVLIYIKVWRRDILTDTKDAQMERMQKKSKVLVTVVCDICFKVWRRDITTDTKGAQMERMQQKSKVLVTVVCGICFKVWRRDIPTDTKDAQMERMQQKSKVLVTVVCDICFKVWRRDIPTDTKDAQMERMQQKSKVLVTVVCDICFKVWRRDIPTDTKDAQMERMQQKSKVLVTVVCDICFKVWRRDIPTDTKDAQMERMQQKSKVKVVKMLVAVVILFVLSWLPLYTIFARIKLGGKTARWEEDVIQVVTPIAQWLGSSNSCINPILYAFFNKKYRRGFVAIFKSRRCCGRLRYYESVMMSSSASLRKSSYYVNNNNSSTRRPAPGQDTSVSYIFNNTGV